MPVEVLTRWHFLPSTSIRHNVALQKLSMELKDERLTNSRSANAEHRGIGTIRTPQMQPKISMKLNHSKGLLYNFNMLIVWTKLQLRKPHSSVAGAEGGCRGVIAG
jgi:hypothetical protein